MLWVAIGFACAGLVYHSCEGFTAEHLFISQEACMAWADRESHRQAVAGNATVIGCTDIEMPPAPRPKERNS